MSLPHVGLSKQQGFSGTLLGNHPLSVSDVGGYLRVKIQSLFGVLWSVNCYNTNNMEMWERKKQGVWKIFRLCRLEISKRNPDPEDSDWCSMWSAQLPDTGDSQAWGTAGVTGPLPGGTSHHCETSHCWTSCWHSAGFSPEGSLASK